MHVDDLRFSMVVVPFRRNLEMWHQDESWWIILTIGIQFVDQENIIVDANNAKYPSNTTTRAKIKLPVYGRHLEFWDKGITGQG